MTKEEPVAEGREWTVWSRSTGEIVGTFRATSPRAACQLAAKKDGRGLNELGYQIEPLGSRSEEP